MKVSLINVGLENPVYGIINVVSGKEDYEDFDLLYFSEGFDVISRDVLLELSGLSEHVMIFHTNAGVDLHSSEKVFKNIIIHKISYEVAKASKEALLLINNL